MAQYYEIQEQELVEYLDQLFKDIQLLLDIAYRQGLYEFPAEGGETNETDTM